MLSLFFEIIKSHILIMRSNAPNFKALGRIQHTRFLSSKIDSCCTDATGIHAIEIG
jgi:hypothetical protein